MSEKANKKTFYRINNGALETIRRVVCPEGWTLDKASLQIQLGVARCNTVEIATDPSVKADQKIEQLQTDQRKVKEKLQESFSIKDVENNLSVQQLREALILKTKEAENYRKESEALQKRLKSDPQTQRRLAEERRDREAMELERTAEFAKSTRVNEDEFYNIKNQLAGFQLREKTLIEEIGNLKKQVDDLHNRNHHSLNEIERLHKIISGMNRIVPNTERLELCANELAMKIQSPDPMMQDVLKKLETQRARCLQGRTRIKDLLERAGWQEPDPEDSLLPEG